MSIFVFKITIYNSMPTHFKRELIIITIIKTMGISKNLNG